MHVGAWVAWVLLVVVVALATTNPLYLAILLLSIVLVATAAPRTTAGVASFRVLVTFGTGILLFSVLIATVNGSYGDHILFTIPGPDVPSWLGGLRLGGPVSGEGLVAAAVRGLAILCIFLAFGVFTSAISPYRLLRSTPGALFHASLVLTVGLTLLPSTVEDLRRIREMRALRGAPGGLRQLSALVVPAVINGLERSMQLAEAMEARGYAASAVPSRSARLAAAASAPVFVASAWLWFYTDTWRPAGALGGLAGLLLLGWWFWAARRAHRTTKFLPEPLPIVQRMSIAGSLVLAVAVLVLRATGTANLTYNPFAGLPTPHFGLLEALLIAATSWPAVVFVAFPTREAAASEAESVPAGMPEPAS